MCEHRVLILAAATCVSFLAGTAFGITHDESVNGDLSNDRLAPTGYTLAFGTNSITATSVSGDREYVRLSVPAGMQLASIVNVSYTGVDQTAFIAVQSGTTFTEPPTGTNVANLLGYSHFGPAVGTVGTDVLDNLGAGAGAIGFIPPLPAGDYTYWMQQTGGSSTTYRFDFNVTPEPASALLLGLGTMLAPRFRRRSRHPAN